MATQTNLPKRAHATPTLAPTRQAFLRVDAFPSSKYRVADWSPLISPLPILSHGYARSDKKRDASTRRIKRERRIAENKIISIDRWFRQTETANFSFFLSLSPSPLSLSLSLSLSIFLFSFGRITHAIHNWASDCSRFRKFVFARETKCLSSSKRRTSRFSLYLCLLSLLLQRSVDFRSPCHSDICAKLRIARNETQSELQTENPWQAYKLAGAEGLFNLCVSKARGTKARLKARLSFSFSFFFSSYFFLPMWKITCSSDIYCSCTSINIYIYIYTHIDNTLFLICHKLHKVKFVLANTTAWVTRRFIGRAIKLQTANRSAFYSYCRLILCQCFNEEREREKTISGLMLSFKRSLDEQFWEDRFALTREAFPAR